MDYVKYFDVLVVYSSAAAISASKKLVDVISPFSPTSNNSNYNDAYSYFLKSCKSHNLSAAFSSSSDIVDAGKCSSYWLFEDNIWKRIAKPCYSNHIFDKLSPIHHKARKQRKLLFSSPSVNPFNNEYLSKLFTDKFETYKKLSSFSIPTVLISNKSKSGIAKHVRQLRQLSSVHRNSADFTNEIILKDRFGAGGNNIFKVDKNFSNKIYEIVHSKNKLSFILQPFLKFQTGFSFEGKAAATDIRLIYLNEKLIQTYIRIAKSNDFRCNEHKGGKLIYVNFNDIPKKVLKVSRLMIKVLKQKKALFALDFVVSDNGNVYFLEGNTGPGIDWNLKLKKNELKSKQLIRYIVKEFASRIEESKNELADRNTPDTQVYL